MGNRTKAKAIETGMEAHHGNWLKGLEAIKLQNVTSLSCESRKSETLTLHQSKGLNKYDGQWYFSHSKAEKPGTPMCECRRI